MPHLVIQIITLLMHTNLELRAPHPHSLTVAFFDA